MWIRLHTLTYQVKSGLFNLKALDSISSKIYLTRNTVIVIASSSMIIEFYVRLQSISFFFLTIYSAIRLFLNGLTLWCFKEMLILFVSSITFILGRIVFFLYHKHKQADVYHLVPQDMLIYS